MTPAVSHDDGSVRLVFLGAPGCGKGTQSAFLRQEMELAHLSTGDMLREALASGTEIGKMAKQIMERGDLVSDDVILQLVEQRMAAPDCRKGFILDGFPRTLGQAEALLSLVEKRQTPLGAVIYFDIPESVLLERVCGRRVHLPSGRIYHVHFNPPKVPGVDDVTGEPLTHRKDDNEETMKKRFEVYRQETRPLVEFFKKKGLLHTVDATLPPSEISQRISSIIDALRNGAQ